MSRFTNCRFTHDSELTDIYLTVLLSLHPISIILLQPLESLTDRIYSTVNRGDFGQIFTIFINIFIMMNSILGFIWGLVSTM